MQPFFISKGAKIDYVEACSSLYRKRMETFKNRTETITFLAKALETLDDKTLSSAVLTFTAAYAPQMLLEHIEKTTQNTVVEKTVQNTVVEKTVYEPPPRVRDEGQWPYMRCKNIVRALYKAYRNHNKIPRSHYALLEYIAKLKKVSVEELKKTSVVEYFKKDPNLSVVLSVLSNRV
jgi:hypothetical protein